MGYRIKELRKSKNMTQEELAVKSGVSRTIISLLESDEDRITTTKTLCKIATALDTTVDSLFFDRSV